MAGGVPDRQDRGLPDAPAGALLGSPGEMAQAIALADDLVAINPDSPYADRLLYLAAECEEKHGLPNGPRSGYQSLLTDYPGSPLVGNARKKMAQLTRKTAPGDEAVEFRGEDNSSESQFVGSGVGGLPRRRAPP